MKAIIFLILVIPWFACKNNNAIPSDPGENDTMMFTQRGDSLVKFTFETLKKTLFTTMNEQGIAGAVKFCNLKAPGLTSIYAQQNISVTRVSDKPRNPVNKLPEAGKSTWNNYLSLAAKNDSMPSMVVAGNKETHYYKPIVIQPMCLSCHGSPGKEIGMEVLKVIDSLYPSDLAKGYKTGDLRGMWHIVFKNTKEK